MRSVAIVPLLTRLWALENKWVRIALAEKYRPLATPHETGDVAHALLGMRHVPRYAM